MRALAATLALAFMASASAATTPDTVSLAPEGGVASNNLTLGQTWPEKSRASSLPAYTITHYGLAQAEDWRASDGAIYRIDPETRLITSIVALVTGDDFTIGQRAPAGYDVYNVPLAYRDRWQDGRNALYRYADGRIYRIDPQSRLVAAAFDIPAIPPA